MTSNNITYTRKHGLGMTVQITPDRVTFLAGFNYTGTSSMEVGVKALAEKIRSLQKRHANSCFFTMVAVDDDRHPVALPVLRPGNERAKRRYAQPLLRKDLRLELSSRLKLIKAMR